MKTTALGLANLCVSCHAACRYCLLSSQGKRAGVSYERGKKLAERLMREMGEGEEGIHLTYYIGYCMDTPFLLDYIRFCAAHDMPSARFLQMNGFHFMANDEICRLMDDIAAAGVEMMDFTFYGNQSYHDRFAGRQGDFDLLLRMMKNAGERGITSHASVPVTKENLNQLVPLLSYLKESGAGEIRFFLPHSKGRGWTMRDQRITARDYQRLPTEVKRRSIKAPQKTEAQWIKENRYPEIVSRVLTLVPTPENIGQIESMNLSEIMAALEQMDDQYRRAMPPMEELARLYGHPDGDKLFRLRDLMLLWKQQYTRDHGLHDMQDESRHFSAYIYE